MANNFFQQDINITLRLRVNGKLREKEGKLVYGAEIDIDEAKKFVNELAELCEKYNYDVETSTEYEVITDEYF